MRFARPEATAAFWRLIDTDDVLLATESVVRLVVYLGDEDPATVRPIIERMLASVDAAVREFGGQLAAFAAMEWDISDYLAAILNGADEASRRGAASLCARHLPSTSNSPIAASALSVLFNDGGSTSGSG